MRTKDFEPWLLEIRAHEPYRKLLDAKDAKKMDAEYFKRIAAANRRDLEVSSGFTSRMKNEFDRLKEKIEAAKAMDMLKMMKQDGGKFDQSPSF